MNLEGIHVTGKLCKSCARACHTIESPGPGGVGLRKCLNKTPSGVETQFRGNGVAVVIACDDHQRYAGAGE